MPLQTATSLCLQRAKQKKAYPNGYAFICFFEQKFYKKIEIAQY